MITYRVKGNYKKTESFLSKMEEKTYLKHLDEYGKRGVDALKESTPKDTGKTSESWYYEITEEAGCTVITWGNKNLASSKNGDYKVNIAVILQYGHATKNGGWIAGRDYINPAIRPIFDEIVKDAWMEVVGK